ncbi:flagellar motor protein MotB, partial [Abyssibius alkaniclasticus]
MAENTNIRPIIKKKKNVQAAGHHGGAWKVAYADFVTAMMAFFLLMWLLNATTEEQRKGIAAYFNPGIPAYMATGGGDGMFNGEDLFTEMTENQSGTGASEDYPTELENAAGDTGGAPVEDAAEEQFSEIESLFRGDSGES